MAPELKNSKNHKWNSLLKYKMGGCMVGESLFNIWPMLRFYG